MRSIWITALTLAVGVLGSPLATADPQLQAEKRQFGNLSTVLPDLLHRIQSETGALDKLLDLHPGPITDDVAKGLSDLVGSHLQNVTDVLHNATSALQQLGDDAELVDEDGKPCNTTCIIDKFKEVIKHAGGTTRKSLLKLGLHYLGTHVSPFFLALSGMVLVLNTIVGGALAAIAFFVNGIGLSIAGGLAYLGHLVSEKEKLRVGGPDGPMTKHIGDLIGNLIGKAMAT